MDKNIRHPIQPLIIDKHGCIRFKDNAIVGFLSAGRFNELAAMDFEQEDHEQLAQLIGYSLDGFGTLSYVSDETYERAAAQLPNDNEAAGKNIQPIERFVFEGENGQSAYEVPNKAGDWVRYEDHVKALSQQPSVENERELPPLPCIYALQVTHACSKGGFEALQTFQTKTPFKVGLFTADQMRAYALAAIAALSPAELQLAYEAAAQVCDRLKRMMDAGGGEYQPGERLGQAARLIRELADTPTATSAAGQQPDEGPRLIIETIGDNIAITPDRAPATSADGLDYWRKKAIEMAEKLAATSAAGQQEIETLRTQRDELARQLGELIHSDLGMRAFILLMERDQLQKKLAGQQEIPEGWKWMTHPKRNNGNPIPVRFYAEDGMDWYQPFDETWCDFLVKEMSPDWKEAALSAAPTPEGDV